MKIFFRVLFYLFFLRILTLIFNTTMYYNGVLGYCRDECIYESSIISNGLWLIMLLLLVAFIILVYIIFTKKSILILFSVVIVVMGFSIFQWLNVERFYNDFFKANITNITLEQLDYKFGQKEKNYVYVGRENCPQCIDFYPDLEDITINYKLKISYYNTILDREERPNEMRDVLDKLGVKSVPVVLVLFDNQVMERFEGENITEDLRYYYSNQFKIYNDTCYTIFKEKPEFIRSILYVINKWGNEL